MNVSSSNSLPYEHIQILKNLTHLKNSSSGWILKDATIVPSNQLGRHLYTLFIKRFDCLRRLFGIDLKQTRLTLEKIKQRIPQGNSKLVRLFNKAVFTFNEVAPKHSVSYIESTEFLQLCQESLALVRQAPASSYPSFKETEDSIVLKAVGYECLPHFIWEQFEEIEKRGGKLVFLNRKGLGELWPHPIEVNVQTEFYPVCHAGLIRSAMLYQVLTAILKHRLNVQCPVTVQRQHGTRTSYEVDPRGDDHWISDKEYAKSFRQSLHLPRPYRFGKELTLASSRYIRWPSFIKESYLDSRDYFKAKYYTKPTSSLPRVYLCFNNNCFHVIERLLDCNASLEGISVIVIPDDDWISKPLRYMNQWALKQLKKECLNLYHSHLNLKPVNENPVDYLKLLKAYERILDCYKKDKASNDHQIIALYLIEEILNSRSAEQFEIHKWEEKETDYLIEDILERLRFKGAFFRYASLFQPVISQ